MEVQAGGIVAQAQVQFGKTLDSAVMKKGLLELNPNLTFDVGGQLGIWHPNMDKWQGVFLYGAHVCSMDRGIAPEFKLWDATTAVSPCSWNEADDEDTSLKYEEILAEEAPNYIDLCHLARLGTDPSYAIQRGKLFRVTPHKRRVVARRCVKLGWRHTFERMLNREVPGITRQALAAKFGVDMYKYPAGSPEEVMAALLEE